MHLSLTRRSSLKPLGLTAVDVIHFEHIFGCLTTSLLPVFFFLLSLPPSSLWKDKHIERSVPGTGSLSGLRSLVAYYLHDDVFFSLWSIKNKHPVLQSFGHDLTRSPWAALDPWCLEKQSGWSHSTKFIIKGMEKSQDLHSNLAFSDPFRCFLAYFVLLCGKIM